MSKGRNISKRCDIIEANTVGPFWCFLCYSPVLEAVEQEHLSLMVALPSSKFSRMHVKMLSDCCIK